MSVQLLKCCIHFNDETSVGLVSLLLQTELNLLKRLYQLCEARNPLIAACSSCGLLSCLPLLGIKGLEPANCRLRLYFLFKLVHTTETITNGASTSLQMCHFVHKSHSFCFSRKNITILQKCAVL